jgi:hypothetical protein
MSASGHLRRRFKTPKLPITLRDFTPYFEGINTKAEEEGVGLAKELIEAESGRFEPEKMPDIYAETLRELLRAKVEQRAPQIEVAPEGKAPKEVINIMAALKESIRRRGAPRWGRRCEGGQACRRREGKAESFTTKANPPPDSALREASALPNVSKFFNKQMWPDDGPDSCGHASRASTEQASPSLRV